MSLELVASEMSPNYFLLPPFPGDLDVIFVVRHGTSLGAFFGVT